MHELLAIEVWKQKVFPLLSDKAAANSIGNLNACVAPLFFPSALLHLLVPDRA